MSFLKPLSTIIVRLTLVLFLTASTSALAQDTTAPENPETPIVILDDLFAQLKAAPDAADANAISGKIWAEWLNPKDPALAELMSDATIAKRLGNAERTLDILAHITSNYPTYAEGWNSRATLHFELGNYEQSLEDIEETLKHEPRHFGALSGRALIYLALGDRVKAREAILEARQYHPFIGQNPPFNTLVEPMLRT